MATADSSTKAEVSPVGPWSGHGPLPAWIDPWFVTRHYLRRTWHEKLCFAAAGVATPERTHGGGWDRRAGPCERHRTYRLLAELYAADLVPERTALYRRLMDDARAGRPQHRRGMSLVDEDAIRRFFADYVALFEGMRNQGYRPGAGRDEPGVAIARDGEIIKVASGNHRFAIARILGLAPIPVQVQFVHRQWHLATPRGPDRVRRAVERAIEAAAAGDDRADILAARMKRRRSHVAASP